MFLPDGQMSAAHRYTLNRLRALPGGLLAIVATASPDLVPRELMDTCDAVYWKGESGYDFSAYARVFREVAMRSSGADLLVLNDSILGPFGDLEPVLAHSPWDLTGFTAWSAFEHHVQSYVLFCRKVTGTTVTSLRTVLPSRFAFNRFQDVVNWQETRLARVASLTMSVGALWFEPDPSAGDPSITSGVPLVLAGFPFLKRSLFGGKLAHRADQEQVRSLLEERGHPV
jgi:lipopolysaccharide biosynthesis protein